MSAIGTCPVCGGDITISAPQLDAQEPNRYRVSQTVHHAQPLQGGCIAFMRELYKEQEEMLQRHVRSFKERLARYVPPGEECSGSGRRWGVGTGSPICPVCHRGPLAFGVKGVPRVSGRYKGTVPTHRKAVTS